MDWVRVFPHERSKYQSYETREANTLHWSLGQGHFTTLQEYAVEIGKSCTTCGGSNCIKTEAWLCPNCNEALIEMENPTLSPQEIAEITSKEIICASCRQKVMLYEMMSCSQCGKPARADIFDVDMDVKRAATADGNQTTLIITGWSAPKPVDPRFAEYAKNLPLSKIFAPDSLERQEDLWGTSPRQPVPDQQSREYQAGTGVPCLGPGGKVSY
jgi:predicted RNA-binding Zn-ribbon protein involved in translation (DUF1610 family)